jgi:hypothetical protein
VKEIDNLTPFGYDSAFAYDLDDSAVAVLCVAGRFRMPAPGKFQEKPLEILEEQVSPAMADEYWSDPATSSLRSAGQGVPQRPRTEIYVRGSAWAYRGRPTTRMQTSVQVGTCSKYVDIVGDRYWVRSLVGVVASSPEPFVRIPLLYERSFGGTAWDKDGCVVAQNEHNPVGRGVYHKQHDAADQPLPNLEAPGEIIDSWDARGTPTGYGPIPSSWQPRRSMAGTYDSEWLENRMPLWPRDSKPEHFCAAASGLSMAEPLHGGEIVSIEGMSPDGVFAFRVPEYRVVAKSVYADNREVRGMMRLDGLLLEPDEKSVTLFWRRSVPLGHGSRIHVHSIVRLLESWEDLPQ